MVLESMSVVDEIQVLLIGSYLKYFMGIIACLPYGL